MIQIKHRFNDTVLYEADCATIHETLKAALKNDANLSSADLYGADLRGATLRGATLRSADLRGADLSSADLYGADLRDAILHGADLRHANLRHANLRDADLRGADLHGADLYGALLNWLSHDLLAELLRRDTDDIDELKVAGLVLINPNWCWEKFINLGDPLTDWALDKLAKFIVNDDDDAPDCVRKRVTKTITGGSL